MVKRLPALVETEAFGILLRHDLVEHLVRALRIELGVLLRLALVEELVLGLDRHLRRSALADIDEIDDLLPVDRMAERDAEILVLEDLALDRIGRVQVEQDDGVVRRQVLDVDEAVIAGLLAVEQHRLEGRVVDVAEGEVELAGGHLQRHELRVVELGPGDAVDIGELVAGRCRPSSSKDCGLRPRARCRHREPSGPTG